MFNSKNVKVLVINGNQDYHEFVKLIFKTINSEINVEIKTKHDGSRYDLVVFTGGEDVNPVMYGQKVGKYTGINSRRDNIEEDLFHSISYQTPKLGICRGSQFLTVINGGKLIQHVENHGISTGHNIQLCDEAVDYLGTSLINITSTHHQMMYPFEMKEDLYKIIAYSEYFRSPVYLNGNDEKMILPLNFVEPEIVHYPKFKSLAIQGHPEYMDYNSQNVKNIVQLIIKYLF